MFASYRSVFVLLMLVAPVARADGPAIRLDGKIDGKSKATFDVTGLDAATLAQLAKDKRENPAWHALFAVRVAADKPDAKAPPLLGSYRVENSMLRFEPRFPLMRGIHYRAVFDPSQLPGRKAGKAIAADFFELKFAAKPTTVVEHVYPTRNKLPENQLKFYLHFSAPMGRGGAYRHIQLLDAAGKEIEAPFLELDEELWSPDGKRFTLFFDPGRIKRGLKPREEVGPALEEGKRYTLVIDRQWTDAEGNPLKETFRKAFSVGPPIDEAIEPNKWRFVRPQADEDANRWPLKVIFPKPLDHALLQRMLWVVDAAGKKVEGNILISGEQTCWEFHHSGVWREGGYHLVVNTALEDLAGNNVGRPFEVDVFRPVQRELKTATIKLPFRVDKPERPRP